MHCFLEPATHKALPTPPHQPKRVSLGWGRTPHRWSCDSRVGLDTPGDSPLVTHRTEWPSLTAGIIQHRSVFMKWWNFFVTVSMHSCITHVHVHLQTLYIVLRTNYDTHTHNDVLNLQRNFTLCGWILCPHQSLLLHPIAHIKRNSNIKTLAELLCLLYNNYAVEP